MRGFYRTHTHAYTTQTHRHTLYAQTRTDTQHSFYTYDIHKQPIHSVSLTLPSVSTMHPDPFKQAWIEFRRKRGCLPSVCVCVFGMRACCVCSLGCVVCVCVGVCVCVCSVSTVLNDVCARLPDVLPGFVSLFELFRQIIQRGGVMDVTKAYRWKEVIEKVHEHTHIRIGDSFVADDAWQVEPSQLDKPFSVDVFKLLYAELLWEFEQVRAA